MPPTKGMVSHFQFTVCLRTFIMQERKDLGTRIKLCMTFKTVFKMHMLSRQVSIGLKNHFFIVEKVRKRSPSPSNSKKMNNGDCFCDRWIRRLQYASGILLGPFIGAHLLGHSLTLIPSNPAFQTANNYLLVVRELYQGLEKAGAGVILIHIGCGLYFWIQRGCRLGSASQAPFWARSTGLFLASTIFGHVYYTRIAALMAWKDSAYVPFLCYCRVPKRSSLKF
jgi:succinate dehydrogenase/fumarate reductase cytochrome b subunit